VNARMIATDLDVPVSDVHAMTFGAELRAAQDTDVANVSATDRESKSGVDRASSSERMKTRVPRVRVDDFSRHYSGSEFAFHSATDCLAVLRVSARP
jgi:hypothetical protein